MTPSPEQRARDRRETYLALGVYGAAGIQLAIAVVGGFFAGNALDQKFSTAPWMAVVGLMLGFAAGLWNLIRLLDWQRKRHDPERKKS